MHWKTIISLEQKQRFGFDLAFAYTLMIEEKRVNYLLLKPACRRRLVTGNGSAATGPTREAAMGTGWKW